MRRHYPAIMRYLQVRQSIMVLGPRGTGKTYYLSSLAKNFPPVYAIDLLNQRTFTRYLKTPSLLFDEIHAQIQQRKTDGCLLIFIDEIQLLPKLLNEVHRSIEQFQEQCVFLLTGSSARKLKRENANLLAGRAIRCDFFPLSHCEYDIASHLDQILQWGSLPKALLAKSDAIKAGYLETYVHTYLREEIQRESEIRNLEAFSRFLELAAVYNGRPINFAKIGRAAGVDGKTVKEYFTVLEDTLLAFALPAWSYSMVKQLQKAPKFYLFDNGVINALTGDLRADLKSATYRYGALFESLIINEIYRLRSLEFPEVKMYHYRTLNGQEVDLILQKNISTPPVAIEIKSQSDPVVQDIKSLLQFGQDFPNALLYVICQTPVRYVAENVVFVPYIEGFKIVLKAAAGVKV